MLSKYIFISLLFLVVGCGSNNERKKSNPTEEPKQEEQNLTETPTTVTLSTPIPTTTPAPSPTIIEKNLKTVTLYVHGYEEKGYKAGYDYGQNYYDTFRTNLIKYTELPTMDDYNKEHFTNLITAVDYYGNTPPSYYDAKDLEDIEKIEATYGGGIPKYAHIVAKFAKNALKESGASKINIVSVSMGSLVSRWLIEKDVEHLASQKKIAKWITIEGVLHGNYALSQVEEDSFLNIFIENSADTDHMKYKWIEENLNATSKKINPRLYEEIELSQISLTNGENSESLLKYVLPLYDGFLPNDGVQLFRDTYFDANLSHTVLHEGHIDVKNSMATFLNINNFLKAKKRIQITLLNASLTNIHEDITDKNRVAEVVFESKIFSPKAKEQWDLEKPIDERVYKSGILNIYPYKKENTIHAINQILFDGFVHDKEIELTIFLEGFEIDNSTIYAINESGSNSNRDSLGSIQTTIKLENGVYAISSDNWSGYIKVEVIDI